MPDPRSRVRGPRPWLALIFLAFASTARAQTPALIGNPLFAFPGGYLNPAVAVSAGRAMADPWLGESPYWNPAAPVEFLGELSLQGSHIERQDIRANNREVDETFAFFSGGGAAIGAPLTKWLGVWLYASRPEARFEENAFRAGTSTDPSVVPAVVQSRTESRESRGGVGVSTKFGAFRLGAAVEATKRNDEYQLIEDSAGPTAGERTLSFEGDAIGWQAGVHWASSQAEAKGRFEAGVAVRRLTELEVTGSEIDELVSGSTTTPADATREAGWEGGASLAYGVSNAFRVMGGVGGRTAQEWVGFGVTTGQTVHWALAADLRDPESTFGFHFGIGGDQQDDVAEPRSSVFGLGVDWALDKKVILTLSGVRRGLQRDDAPTSWDTRVMGGVRAAF